MGHDTIEEKKWFSCRIVSNEAGYFLIIVTVVGVIFGIILSYVIPLLHTGRMIRASNNLNEYRAHEAARKGVDAVRLGFKGVNSVQSLRGNAGSGKGILWAVDQVVGGVAGPVKYDEYYYPDGSADGSGCTVQFVSGCTMSLPGNEGARLDIAILTTNAGSGVSTYVYNNTSGANWLSGATVAGFEVVCDGSVFYCDFESGITGCSGVSSYADFKYSYADETGASRWGISIGNDASFRKKYAGAELWQYNRSVISGVTPVFVIVRSTGKTATPGPNYLTNKGDLLLVSKKGKYDLPDPMRQVLEAGFYLEDDGIALTEIERFYYCQARNLTD